VKDGLVAGATRRRVLSAGLVTVGGLALTAKSAWAADQAVAAGTASTAIHMEEEFTVPPPRVYEALMDGKQFSAFTKGRAAIDRAPGGEFKLFDDRIVGRNIELVPNRRVVQAWREPSWDEGIYSIVKFDLKPQGSGTRIVFDHWGFPEAARAHLIIGWKEHYWDDMRKYFQG